jgi:Kef-type K+ transport system membrane component KefB
MIRKLVLGFGLLMDLVGVFMLWYIAPRIIHDDSGIYAPDISYMYFLVAVTVLVIALVLLAVGITYPDFSRTGQEEELTGKKDQI